jgi:hypothetical protein
MRKVDGRLRLAVAAAPLATVVAPARAQQAVQVDAGSFEHRVGEAYVGTETFAVRRRGEDLVVVGRVTRDGDAGALQSVETGMRVDRDGHLVRYELQSREGPSNRSVVSRAGARLRVTTTSDSGERFTEHLADDRLLILETDVAHHYVLLARRLRAAPDPRAVDLEVLIPGRGRIVPLRVNRLSRDTLTVGDRREAVTRYDLVVGGEPTNLWIATDGARVIQVAIPGRDWVAARTPRE